MVLPAWPWLDVVLNWLAHGTWQLSAWQLVAFTLLMTHITIASVTIYLHRHQAHRSLDLHWLPAHFFRLWLWLTTGMTTKAWAAIHRKHHAKCESDEDPHSPQVMGIQTVFWQGAELYRREANNAETLRKLLLEGLVEKLSPASEAMIFSAARIDHLDKLIRPALARGAYVICDRFADSTRAYQGGALSENFIDQLEQLAVGGTVPDLTFILDLPAEEGIARADARRGNGKADRFESEAIDFHRNLRQAFLKIAERNPQRCVGIDARRSVDEIAQDIWHCIYQRLIGGHR